MSGDELARARKACQENFERKVAQIRGAVPADGPQQMTRDDYLKTLKEGPADPMAGPGPSPSGGLGGSLGQVDPDTGTGDTADEHTAAVADLVAKVIKNNSLDLPTKKAKVAAAMKLLDDGADKPAGPPEPKDKPAGDEDKAK